MRLVGNLFRRLFRVIHLPPQLQLLRVQGQPTALAAKLRYYANPEFQGLYPDQDAA